MPHPKNTVVVIKRGCVKLLAVWQALLASLAKPGRDWYKPPNLVTMARMLLALPVALFALVPGLQGWIGFGCYIVAVGTDFVDGKLAKMNGGRWITNLGKILDPLADKVINLTALGVLIARLENEELRWLVIAATVVIVVRELVVAWSKSRQPLASASEAGRFAMGALVVAIMLLLIPTGLPFLPLFGATMFALGASCAAGWAYTRPVTNHNE